MGYGLGIGVLNHARANYILTYLTIIISSIQIVTYMKKRISQYLEKIENATPRTILITGFLSGVGIDPEGTRLWAVKKIIEVLRIGENSARDASARVY